MPTVQSVGPKRQGLSVPVGQARMRGDVPAVASGKSQHTLFHYVSPTQAIALLVGGVVTSLAFRWVGSALWGKQAKTFQAFLSQSAQAAKGRNGGIGALQSLAKQREHQTAIFFDQGLPSIFMFALKYPVKPVQDRLKAYLGAIGSGYALGSIAQGFQEIWIRREETQIRANLIDELKQVFRKSFDYKLALDNRLRRKAKDCIRGMLSSWGVTEPERFLKPTAPVRVNPFSRYPYEPVHFSRPATPVVYRFSGEESNQPKLMKPTIAEANPMERLFVKMGLYAGGLGVGLIGQSLLSTIRQPNTQKAMALSKQMTKYFEIVNVRDMEALFLMGNNRLLIGVIALVAAAKAGKMLLDGYREIEVTRQHAATELRYQTYNWLSMDPNFHRISEEAALRDSLVKLYYALPQERHYPGVLKDRIETILANIGRESAPKYFPMTPSVNLVPARG